MGANGPHKQAECKRGHRLDGFNAMDHNGGRRCRACNRAQSQLHNGLKRYGQTFNESDMQRVSDDKYRRIKSALTSGS